MQSTNQVQYLKNVVLSFLSTGDAAEKRRLLPVLAAIFRLSREECASIEQQLASEQAGLVGFARQIFG